MLNQSFPDQVRRQFDFLFVKHGFTLEDKKYTEFPYSEWLVRLCSDELCIRVSIDKSQVFVDVGVPRDKIDWLDLMYLMIFLTNDVNTWKYLWIDGEVNEEHYDKQLRYLSKTLEENYAKIKEATINIKANKNEKKRFMKIISKYSDM